jgi:hypothetical protein
VIRKVREEEFVTALLEEIKQMTVFGFPDALPVSTPGKGPPGV